MKFKKPKFLVAALSAVVLLSGTCLVGCDGQGAFQSSPTFTDWKEGENKVGDITINLTGFNKVELSDTTDKNDVESVARSACEMLFCFGSQCLQKANDGKGLSDYKDQIKLDFLTSELSKCDDNPTDKSLIESTAKDMAANHISYFQNADDSGDRCVLYQVEMSDDVWNKILNQEEGASTLYGITEVAPGVYKTNCDDGGDSSSHYQVFYCVRNNGIFTLIYPYPCYRSDAKTLLSKIVSY